MLTGIEKFFCSSWSGWDLLDTGVFMFYDPVLIDEVKEKLKLETVAYIVVDTTNCLVQFYVNPEDDMYLDLEFKIQF